MYKDRSEASWKTRVENAQSELVSLVRRFFNAEIDSEYLQHRLNAALPTQPELWEQLCALGFFEAFGETSLDEDPFKLFAEISRAAGFAILPEGLCEALLSGPLLLRLFLDQAEQKQLTELLGAENAAAIMSGSKRLAYAPIAEQREKGFEFSGVLLTEDTVGVLFDHRDRLHLVPLQTGQYQVTDHSALDRLLPRSRVQLSDTDPVSFPSVSTVRWQAAVRLMVAAELLGVAERTIELTTQYVSERKQFGVAVGCFQAVQHPLADAYLRTKELEALLSFLSDGLDREDRQYEFLSEVAIAAAVDRVPWVVERAIQLHGGIGFTWEYPLHLALRRAKTYAALFRARFESICTHARGL